MFVRLAIAVEFEGRLRVGFQLHVVEDFRIGVCHAVWRREDVRAWDRFAGRLTFAVTAEGAGEKCE
jgi:hypothetical protein